MLRGGMVLISVGDCLGTYLSWWVGTCPMVCVYYHVRWSWGRGGKDYCVKWEELLRI